MIYRVNSSSRWDSGTPDQTFCLTRAEALEWARVMIEERDCESVVVFAAKTPRTKQQMTYIMNGGGWREIFARSAV
jgi:hypothetical protein